MNTLALQSVTLMETIYHLVQLFELWPRTLSSLGDAIVAAVASVERVDAVATFDVTLRKKLAKQGLASYWRR